MVQRTCLVLMALVLACGTPPSAVRVDVQAYVERSKSWAPVEGETARTLERILATQFVDEGEVLRQISESRPRILSHVEALRTYVPRSEPLRRVHERYITAWERLLAGYDAIEQGFRTGDYTKLARGREAMAIWRDSILQVARELRELMRRFGIDAQRATES